MEPVAGIIALGMAADTCLVAKASSSMSKQPGRQATPKALLPLKTHTRPLDFIFPPSNCKPEFVGVIWPTGKALKTINT